MDRIFITARVVSVVDNLNLFTVVCNSNVDFKKEVTYVNVGYNTEDRGRVFHKLKFQQKINKGPEYYYTFEITGPEGHSAIMVDSKVTIQPFNTFLPVISKCDSDSKRITFKVEYSGLYNLQKEYVIQSDCLDKYVKGSAKCVGKDSTTDGPTVTFELSAEDYDTFSEKSHCGFTFAEKGGWFGFKKSKSVKSVKSLKKRAKTPKRSKARKSMKSLKKRTKTPKRSKARKSVNSLKKLKSTQKRE
jgi:hypothetical protein